MATLTKKDLDEPLIPERCKDCEYLLLSYAYGLTRPNSNIPVATCKLNHANETDDALRGTYVPCSSVIFLNPIYKCKYDKANFNTLKTKLDEMGGPHRELLSWSLIEE